MDVTRGVVLTRYIFFLFHAHAQISRDHILASRGSCVKLCTPIERYCCALFVYSIGVGGLVLCLKTFLFYKELNRDGTRFFYIIGHRYTVQVQLQSSIIILIVYYAVCWAGTKAGVSRDFCCEEKEVDTMDHLMVWGSKPIAQMFCRSECIIITTKQGEKCTLEIKMKHKQTILFNKNIKKHFRSCLISVVCSCYFFKLSYFTSTRCKALHLRRHKSKPHCYFKRL